ncbi:type III-B CRISPR module RAMP protein Cmr6 [Lysobacteraceae bacterium NML71-0210]|nr:type III-B CRISPR module RAMP protein Cmr6 [Xanthomonadaceae bacterium NML71-0210]
MSKHLPLYQGADFKAAQGQHYGLQFERFFDAYKGDYSDIDTEERKNWLNQFRNKSIGSSQALQTKALQLRQLVESYSGEARIYHCAGNFVTGLGNPHPLENGFLWHPTLGTPYLPGSAVKGLLRAVIETAYQGNEEDRKALLKRWFGTAEKGDVAEHSGSFVFMDALPVESCQLHVEVMTPHMGRWYEKGGKNPLAADTQPGDWHAPVPVTYLSTRDIKLQFAILPRPGAGDTAILKQELQDLWQALDHGLEYLGAGAKAAIGFGIMQRNTKKEDDLQEDLQAQQRQSQMQSLSPAMQEITIIEGQWQARHQKLRGKKEALNGTIHNQARALAKKAHESIEWSAEEKQAVARLIEEWIPKLVNNLNVKDMSKQLKLGTLKGS